MPLRVTSLFIYFRTEKPAPILFRKGAGFSFRVRCGSGRPTLSPLSCCNRRYKRFHCLYLPAVVVRGLAIVDRTVFCIAMLRRTLRNGYEHASKSEPLRLTALVWRGLLLVGDYLYLGQS